MTQTDMSADELAAFLDEPRLAAIGGTTGDGCPTVEPAAFVRDGSSLVLMPLSPSIPGRRTMSGAEVTAFLQDYRYPTDTASPPYVAISTVRKSGRPFVVPFGYLFDGEQFFLTINNARSLNHRLRRDPRIALGVFSTSLPEQTVVATGVAERIGDDPDVSRAIFERQMRAYPWLDFDSYLSNWLAAGRTTYRLRPQSLVGWGPGDGPGDMALPEPAERSFVSVFNQEFPTRVALLEGPLEACADAPVEAFANRYGSSAPESRAMRLVPERVQTWDTNKQPTERVTQGIDRDGRHVERGSWVSPAAEQDA
jgi:nitroimidazol reductase NimA-like FMN-containing flavoprotein (pyridoxamine 5'-phosphate oxidase superfamily)